MSVITRRDFLPELGKLLAFMHEEDRQIALSMYEKMFDDVENEQELIHFLSSPTRQAVILARVYDSKARKLEVHSQNSGMAQVSGEELPAFVTTINEIHEEALEEQGYAPVVLKDQISFFSDEPEEAETPAVQPVQIVEEPSPIISSEALDAMPEEAAMFMAQSAAVQTVAPVVTPQPVQQVQEPIKAEPEIQSVQPVAEPVPEVPKTEVPEQEEPKPAEPVEDNSVDDFIKSFDLVDDISTAETKPEEKKAAVTLDVTATEKDSIIDFGSLIPDESKAAENNSEITTVRKPKVFMMILYILLAVPVTALGIVVLLLPAVLFLLLAIIAIVAGFSALGAAFGGFSVFADILVVIGIALVIIALGILFLWTFVWFLGGAIVNLINGAIRLGGKLCYKEEQLK